MNATTQTQATKKLVTADKVEQQAHQVVSLADGNTPAVRTFFVFTDLPVHYEFRVSEMPLLLEGTVVEFCITLRDPKSGRPRLVEGPYRVARRKLVYRTNRQSLLGLTQYLEWAQVK